ncbi:Lrp/AsnC ligand binding domain-containing protein [Rhizobium sp. Rhizsp82]|uniref:Lrp/AsnC ligand binding domain-containing protein n=1 Tax=Rhizobium sp. Rhizsp82 TaxID=3243057 RepID=UPI0039B60EBC
MSALTLAPQRMVATVRPASAVPEQTGETGCSEVQEAWCTSGRGDYTLVILAQSVEHFDVLADRMMELNRNIRKFTTSVVLKTLKRTPAVHID